MIIERQKMSNEEFERLSTELKQKINVISEEADNSVITYEEFYKKRKESIENFISIVTKYDLSDIKPELWPDIIFLNYDKLTIDLSNTNANIDLKIINEDSRKWVSFENINLSGCNIINLDWIIGNVNYDSFDEETRKKYPNIFLDDSYDEGFRKRFCSHEITIDDYFSISKEKRNILALRKRIFFLNAPFIEMIDDDDKIEEFIRSDNESTKIISLANDILDNLSKHLGWLSFKEEQKVAEIFLDKLKNSNYTEWKTIIYKYSRGRLLEHLSRIKELDKYPQSFIEENKDIFLIDSNISEELKKKYYNGELKLEDFLGKTDFLPIRIDTSVIDEDYNVCYLIKKYKEDLSRISAGKADLIRTIAMEKDINSIFYNYISIDDLLLKNRFDLYIKLKEREDEKDLSLEELLNRSLQSSDGISAIYKKAVKKIGIDNILKFERDTGLITREEKGIRSYKFLWLLSTTNISDIRSVEDIYIKDVIRQYYNSDDRESYKNIDYLNNTYFSRIMLEESELEGLTEEEKKEIIDKFYKGRLNYTDIRKYPILKEVLQDKDLGFVLSKNLHYCYEGTNVYVGLDYDFHEKQKNNEAILDLWEEYGDIFSAILRKGIEIDGKSIDEIRRQINKKIYESILNITDYNYLSYTKGINEILDNKSLLKQYPSFDIDEKNFTEDELSKDYTVEELASNLDFVKRLGTASVALFISEEYYWITDMFKEKEKPNDAYEANLNRLIVMLEFSKIMGDPQIANEFKKYFLKHNDISNINEISGILQRLLYTNSSVLFSLRQSLLEQLLATNNPLENFNKIEKIFLKNNIPLYAKMYYCFRILYSDIDEKFDFEENSRVSPQLKDGNIEKVKLIGTRTANEKRFMVIYNDLLQIAVKSNSGDMQQYLRNIEQGNDIFNRISEGKTTYEELSDEEKQEIIIFAKHLETIYENSRIEKEDEIDFSSLSIQETLNILKDKISPTERYDLKDRIVRMYCFDAGYKSFNQIKDAMQKSIKNADQRGRKYAEEFSEGKAILDEGDFIRCIGDYQSLGGSLDSGNFSKEYLSTIREESYSDTTPLDIDWSLINSKGTIYDLIKDSPTGFGFGNIYMVIKKDNPSVNITRDSEGNELDSKYDPTKTELFGTSVNNAGWKTHWGIRTGISLTDVDYIIYKKNCVIDINNPYDKNGDVNYLNSENEYDDLRAIKFEIARHGYYIPVVDFAGKLIYTPKEYEELRSQMNGLSYYGNDKYEFSENLVNDKIEEIRNRLQKSKNDTKKKANEVNLLLAKVFEKYNLSLKTKIDGNLTPGSIEVIDTGSTGRTTNEPGDGDFDLLLRIDNKFIANKKLFSKFKEDILSIIKEHNPENIMITDNGDFRIKKVQLDSGDIVDIDLTFDKKTDKVRYTTEVCIKDRLETIRKQNPEKYEYVVSNIILAKQVLKKVHAYKSANSKENEGGLGGVGVENWILQHGGSFYDAATSFLEAAKNRNFEQFKQVYTVWDFGENHLAERKKHYPHDNFVNDNMNEKGYEYMVQALEKYVNDYRLNSVIENKNMLVSNI